MRANNELEHLIHMYIKNGTKPVKTDMLYPEFKHWRIQYKRGKNG